MLATTALLFLRYGIAIFFNALFGLLFVQFVATLNLPKSVLLMQFHPKNYKLSGLERGSLIIIISVICYGDLAKYIVVATEQSRRA